MRLSLITLALALLLLLMHLALFRFLPGTQVIDLAILERFDLPVLFVAEPQLPRASRTPVPAAPTSSASGEFKGPTSQPSVKGPTGPPPNF